MKLCKNENLMALLSFTPISWAQDFQRQNCLANSEVTIGFAQAFIATFSATENEEFNRTTSCQNGLYISLCNRRHPDEIRTRFNIAVAINGSFINLLSDNDYYGAPILWDGGSSYLPIINCSFKETRMTENYFGVSEFSPITESAIGNKLKEMSLENFQLSKNGTVSKKDQERLENQICPPQKKKINQASPSIKTRSNVLLFLLCGLFSMGSLLIAMSKSCYKKKETGTQAEQAEEDPLIASG